MQMWLKWLNIMHFRDPVDRALAHCLGFGYGLAATMSHPFGFGLRVA